MFTDPLDKIKKLTVKVSVTWDKINGVACLIKGHSNETMGEPFFVTVNGHDPRRAIFLKTECSRCRKIGSRQIGWE